MNAPASTSARTAARSALSRQLLWAGVTALSILSAYVHTVNESVNRGALLRQAQRSSDSSLMAKARPGAATRDARFALGNAP